VPLAKKIIDYAWKSMIVVTGRRFHAEIVITAEIDLVVGRGLLVFTGVQILVVTGEIVVLLDQLRLGLLERQRLLRVQLERR